jgi:hypothetical protein
MLDSVSLAPVLLGQRGDDQPVRQTLLIQSSPGRDALADGERQVAPNKVWDEIAKKGAASGSDGMAHALREGPWKLVFDIEHDRPAAIYNLADDLAEQKNLIADPAQTDRIQRMEKLYRDIRASTRSVPVVEAPATGLLDPESPSRKRAG